MCRKKDRLQTTSLKELTRLVSLLVKRFTTAVHYHVQPSDDALHGGLALVEEVHLISTKGGLQRLTLPSCSFSDKLELCAVNGHRSAAEGVVLRERP